MSAIDVAVATRIKAEWYRHGLHDAALRGEYAIPADELRRLVADYQRVLFGALAELEDFGADQGGEDVTEKEADRG